METRPCLPETGTPMPWGQHAWGQRTCPRSQDVLLSWAQCSHDIVNLSASRPAMEVRPPVGSSLMKVPRALRCARELW